MPSFPTIEQMKEEFKDIEEDPDYQRWKKEKERGKE
jgi:hypothetical protein